MLIFLPLFYFSLKLFFKKLLPFIIFFLDKKRERVIGLPKTVSKYWFFQKGKTCAIAAQKIVLSIFDINKDMEDLEKRQKAYGYYHENIGSSSISLLLKGYGLDVLEKKLDRYSFEYDLWKSFKSNKVLLVIVNSYLLNENSDGFSADLNNPIGDHVIILSGLQYKDGLCNIFYTDTGVATGEVKKINSQILKKSLSHSALVVETPSIPNSKLLQEGTDDLVYKAIVLCSKCNKQLRVPRKKVSVVCNRCGYNFIFDARQ